MGAAARLRLSDTAPELLRQAWWIVPFAAWTIPYPNPAFRATVHLSFALPYAALAVAKRHPPSSADLAVASVATLVTVAALLVTSVARATRSLGFVGAVLRTGLAIARALGWILLAGAWFGACLLRHPEAALAASAALFLAADRRRAAWVALASALITIVRPGPALGPVAVLVVVAGALVWAAARQPGWDAARRALRACVVGTAAAAGVTFLAGIVLPPTAGLVRYPSPRRVYDLILAPSGQDLVFTTKGAAAPGVLDRRTGESRSLPDLDPAAFERLAWLPGAARVLSGGGEGATILDLDEGALERRIVGGSIIDVERIGPHRVAIAEEGSEAIHLVDLETGTHEVRTVPHGPYAIELDPAADALFVTSWLDQPKVTRLGLSDFSSVEAFNGWGSTDVCVFPSRREVAIARPAYGDITVLDSVTLARRRTLPTDALVREIECDSARGVIYAASYFDGRISALGVERGQVFDTVRVGPFTRALRFDAASATLFAGSNAGVFELPIELDRRGEVRFGRLEGGAPSRSGDRSRQEAGTSGAARSERRDPA